MLEISYHLTRVSVRSLTGDTQISCVAGSTDEGSGWLDEDEDAREGVALMEGALEELEQARDLLASLEQKVWELQQAY